MCAYVSIYISYLLIYNAVHFLWRRLEYIHANTASHLHNFIYCTREAGNYTDLLRTHMFQVIWINVIFFLSSVQVTIKQSTHFRTHEELYRLWTVCGEGHSSYLMQRCKSSLLPTKYANPDCFLSRPAPSP